MKKRNIIILFGIILFGGVVYATDSVRVSVPIVKLIEENSYPSQELDINNLQIINKDNDLSSDGDYFVGYYDDNALGRFTFNTHSAPVVITNNSANCLDNTSHRGYKLSGFSESTIFGEMNFDYNSSYFTYICIPVDETSGELGYIGGKAYSQYVGIQDFTGLEFDFFVDRDGEHLSQARYTKIEGIASSQNYNSVDTENDTEIRVLGDIQKSSLKKQINQNIYSSFRDIPSNNGSLSVNSLGGTIWSNSGGGSLQLQNNVLFFADVGGDDIEVLGNDNIEGNKTLIVEGANIYIRGNIRNIDNDNAILGLIALSKDGVGGNIYINPTVTDIHASIYAEKSIVSYDGVFELDGDTIDSQLANQLYIYGSVFSENTLGGADSSPVQCPFFENTACTVVLGKKYDFNYLRRYILVSEVDTNGDLTGRQYPNYSASESYMGDDDRLDTDVDNPGYRVYPLVIEYNPTIQTSPPPFF